MYGFFASQQGVTSRFQNMTLEEWVLNLLLRQQPPEFALQCHCLQLRPTLKAHLPREGTTGRRLMPATMTPRHSLRGGLQMYLHLPQALRLLGKERPHHRKLMA